MNATKITTRGRVDSAAPPPAANQPQPAGGPEVDSRDAMESPASRLRSARAPRLHDGLDAGRGGVRIGQRRRPSRANPKRIARATSKRESRAILRATLESFQDQVLFTAAETNTPAGWHALAGRMLEGDLGLAVLARLDEADVAREATLVLVRTGARPEEARSISSALSDGLARAAGHRFFNDLQSSIRLTLDQICTRLRRGPEPRALRDGLAALGRSEALALLEAVGERAPVGTPENHRILAQALLPELERRVARLSRTPEPAQLLADYPGIVTARGALLGVTLERRTTSVAGNAIDRLEAMLAPLVPALEVKRGLQRIFRDEVAVRGDSVLARGLRARCDFDRLLDLTYSLVSEMAVGVLTTGIDWERQGLQDVLLDRAEDEAENRLVDLLGWVASSTS